MLGCREDASCQLIYGSPVEYTCRGQFVGWGSEGVPVGCMAASEICMQSFTFAKRGNGPMLVFPTSCLPMHWSRKETDCDDVADVCPVADFERNGILNTRDFASCIEACVNNCEDESQCVSQAEGYTCETFHSTAQTFVAFIVPRSIERIGPEFLLLVPIVCLVALAYHRVWQRHSKSSESVYSLCLATRALTASRSAPITSPSISPLR